MTLYQDAVKRVSLNLPCIWWTRILRGAAHRRAAATVSFWFRDSRKGIIESVLAAAPYHIELSARSR